jgi:hypothetical protein
MFTPEMLAVVAGFIVPPLTSFLKACDWPISYKTLVCGAVSAVFAIISMAVAGSLTLATFGTSLPIVFATATAFYNLKFKDLKVNQKLETSGVGS